MGDWYTIGLAVGLGVAIGILAAGFFPRRYVAPILAAARRPRDRPARGELAGGARRVHRRLPRRARRDADRAGRAPARRDTRGGIAAIVAGAAVVVAALAFIPFVGYVMAVALPAVGLRTRSREPDRHAGLRTLARD